MKAKRIRNMFVATALTCSMIAVPVFAAPTSTGSLEEQKKAAENEVSGLQSQLTTLMSKMTELQSQLITKGEEISKAEVQLVEAQEKEKEQYEDMKLRIKYMYEEGDGTAVEKILTSGSISEMLSQAEYVQKVHGYDRTKLTEYVETVEEVKNLKTTLETDKNKLESIATDYESQSTELNTIIQDKSAEVANLDQQIQEAARKAAEEEAARQKAAQEQAAKEQAAKENSANTPSNGGGISTGGGTSQGSGTSNDSNTNTGGNTNAGGGTSQGNASVGQAIVNAAMTQLGVPYVWGGSTPYVGLDCSGLTQWAHAQVGISIGRVDTAQLAGGTRVSNPMPGDIAWTPGHVGIYIGGGQMIEAQQDGIPICISSVRASAYVRYW